MKKPVNFIVILLLICSCTDLRKQTDALENNNSKGWDISIIPPSIRIDPSTNAVIDYKPKTYPSQKDMQVKSIFSKNWIYDGRQVNLYAARGEYVSFQLVLSNNTDTTLKNISVKMPALSNGRLILDVEPELFLEWAVQVKTPSSGYSHASLGKGWYPDALIPFKYIQQDSSKVKSRWVYPLWLPDFNNRIDNQRSLIVWVDQYIPFNKEEAPSGNYSGNISVSVGNSTNEIPINLHVWDFAIPNENKFEASLQQEGFLSRLSEKDELEIYQLFKRNRIGLMDPTYTPELSELPNGNINIDWQSFDHRLDKYFTGEAFTKKYGYENGPGYNEPWETFILPFDVYGKYGTAGWPDIGGPKVERTPENKAIYIKTINKVKGHLQPLVNSKKTDLIVYLNGLDESYFPEAWDRMLYYGKLFHEYYPEAHYRIDGAYNEEAMKVVSSVVDYWSAHTLYYDIDAIRKYREMGIKDWVYGPLIYESKVNSWVGSSTFMDLPLVNDRAISWSCWKYGTFSWLSWGIGAGWKNGWYDPESWKNAYKLGADSDSSFNFKKLNGNALLIYKGGVVPNVSGVCPSIRLKTMRDGIQEYEYMRLLAQLDGNNDRPDSIVNTIIGQPFGEKSIGNLDVWSYDAEQWDQTRIQLGKLINQTNKNE